MNDIKKIEDLIVGGGAADFRRLELLTDVFCPFDAIGMIRQEIRHANYLSYILDPNRPHMFGAKFLEEFLATIVEKTAEIELGFSRLDLHFMDLFNARVFREWRHIDILIELPNPSTAAKEKGIVVAIEVKIDATESAYQLSEYEKTVRDNYDENKWNYAFIFLTKTGEQAREENRHMWAPVGLGDVIDRFEEVSNSNKFMGQSANLFNSYVSMMRRNILDNEKLQDLTNRIWSKHKEALEVLYAYKPDLRGDILRELSNKIEKLACEFSKNADFEIVPDTSDRNHIRFCVKDWERFPEMKTGDGTWVKSNSLLAIEIRSSGEMDFGIYLIIGPGKQEHRNTVFEYTWKYKKEEKIKINNFPKKINIKYQGLSKKVLLTSKNYEKIIEKDEVNLEKLLEEIIHQSSAFLKDILPKYNEILENSFNK